MFLPTTPKEVKALGWTQLDIILVTGDTYIDSPFMGVSLIGKLLVDKGFRVGIIAQPDLGGPQDISRLGEPALFWGVTGGAVDSMVANYTALGKRRKSDDYTPGCRNTRRPDRAVIVYTNLIRRFFKETAPIVLGGIEASLRRIAHYDFWSNKIRRAVLFDAKADILLYGMAHHTVLELARALKQGHSFKNIRGLGYISPEPKGLELPPFSRVRSDKGAYAESFKLFYDNCDPITAQGICQRQDSRYMVLNPPPPTSTTRELDELHDLDFQREVHPYYAVDGPVRALDTIRFSIPTHYGCYGECNFCAIAVHQGRTVQFRSKASIVKEARALSTHPKFKGNIMDLGGPTANMYGYECSKKLKKGACKERRCLFPTICKSLKPDHGRHLELIRAVSGLDKVKKVFINSGIRYDLILADPKKGDTYLKKIVQDHVSGQMKVAPEHSQARVLSLMGKQPVEDLLSFKRAFDRLSAQSGKKQFLTYYLIAAHPGCSPKDMEALKRFTREKLHMRPEQVQIFTPTPSTYSTLMYHTGMDPFSNAPLHVETTLNGKERQKAILLPPPRKSGPARGPGDKNRGTPKKFPQGKKRRRPGRKGPREKH